MELKMNEKGQVANIMQLVIVAIVVGVLFLAWNNIYGAVPLYNGATALHASATDGALFNTTLNFFPLIALLVAIVVLVGYLRLAG